MEKSKCSIFKVCAIIVTVMVVFMTGLVTAVVKKGITVKGDFGTVQSGGSVVDVTEDVPLETETVLESVTDESGEIVTDASGEAVTKAVTVTKAAEKTTEKKPTASTSEKAKAASLEAAAVKAAAQKGTPLSWDDQKILNSYKTVVDKVKKDQPTYRAFDYEPIANESSLSKEIVDLMYDCFYRDGTTDVAPTSYDSRMLETRAYSLEHDDDGTGLRKRTDDNGARRDNTKWFAVDRSTQGCLVTDPTMLKDLTAETLPDGNIKIVLYLPDEEKPGNIKPNNPDKMQSIHSGVMNVSEIDLIISLGAAIFDPFTYNQSKSSCTYSGSTSTLIYNPKTNECVSLYQVNRIFLKLYGKLNGVDLSNSAVQINSVFNYFDFDWSSVK